MDLTELYSRLHYGELSNLAMAETTPGEIVASARPKIILHLNDAMKKLYTRFVLKEKALVISVLEGKMDYRLDPAYSSVGAIGSSRIPYIMDNDNDPFTGDVARILEAYDGLGTKLPLNDGALYWSLFTPQADILQIPNQIPGDEVSLSYQALPATIAIDYAGEIEIPVTLESAITSYIASKVYSNMNTAESTVKGQEHFNQYELTCGLLEKENVLSTSNVATTSKFEMQGWV